MSITLDRRGFLHSAGTAVAGTAAASSGVLIAADGAWAMTLAALSKPAAETLIHMARDLYPHASIDDAPYAKVIEKLDQSAAKDAATARLLSDGVNALNAAAGGHYAKAPEAKRVAVLKSMEHTPFFQTVRGAMVNNFYNDEAVWKKLGYEGSSAEFGGYLHRGFDDIAWLPKA
jgi:hypothetical protein